MIMMMMFRVSWNICNLIYWLVQGWIAIRTSSLGAIPGAPSPTCFSHSCLHFTVLTLLLTFHWSFTLSYISSSTAVCALSGNGSRCFRSPFFIKFFICSSSFHHRSTSTISHRTNKTNYPQWKSIRYFVELISICWTLMLPSVKP